MINTCATVLKHFRYTLCFCLLMNVVHAQVREQGIIPQPFKVKKNKEIFNFNLSTSIWLGSGISIDNLDFFEQYFNSIAGYSLPPSKKLTYQSFLLNIDCQ